MEQDLKKQLFERLDKNFTDYNASLLNKSKQELVESSLEIAKTQAVYAYMKNDFPYCYFEAKLLLQLNNPLYYMASRWSLDVGLSDNDYDVIQEMIGELDDPNCPYLDESDEAAQGERTSVLKQLHDTPKEAGQRPSGEHKAVRDSAR